MFPPIQGAIATNANTRISYVVPTIGKQMKCGRHTEQGSNAFHQLPMLLDSLLIVHLGFVVVLAYVSVHWASHGFCILRSKGEKLIATSLEGKSNPSSPKTSND